jgi:hypothetical protein
MGGDSKKEKQKTIFHSEERGMTKKTIEFIFLIAGAVLEALKLIKDKLNGRKGDDRKRDSKKKREKSGPQSPPG